MPKKEELPRPSAMHAGRVWRKRVEPFQDLERDIRISQIIQCSSTFLPPKKQGRSSTTNVGRARAGQMKGRQENEIALLQNSIEPTRAALFPDLGLIVHSNGWG